ncbi:hypothetical protein HFD88_008804 [Aspergillus terreus]|nr:hypothetical protein HFD88_008804 [Aspergillus terreus]
MFPDTAALPSPPDFAPWDNTNPRSEPHGGVYSGSRQNGGTGSYQNSSRASPIGSRRPRFPNIKDLQDQAAALDVSETSSLDELLGKAREAIGKARDYADNDEPDKAYVQYLRASEITINVIPHHPDYRTTVTQRPSWYKQFADLMMAVRTKQGTMGDIKQQILDDNLMSNVQPTNTPAPTRSRPKSEMIPAGYLQGNIHLNSKLHPVFNQIPADIQLLQMSWLNVLYSQYHLNLHQTLQGRRQRVRVPSIPDTRISQTPLVGLLMEALFGTDLTIILIGHEPQMAYIRHTVTAHDLLEYLRRYNVLLIDVRSRDQFDHGHVYAKSIICIEPVALKENVSAEELEERLVVSPEHEQSLFERRNEFDLIVYYDQTTDSVSYLAGSPVGTTAPHLRALHDTLYEFNAYKPLKDGRPPALLLGGLDAWIDLLGQQSLATSSTAAVMGSIQNKRPVMRPGRPLGRVPTMVSANSSLEVRKRRLREYRPLNPEELTAWMEKSRNEEIDTSTYIGEGELTEEPEEETGEEAPPISPFVHTYEDFLRRFPEPHAIQQSMVTPLARPPVPPVPNYAAPVPVAPSRPPPAVPRPSYSGVTDGRQIQPPLERQNSATKTALYTPSSMLSRLKLPRTGLANFGVTCYMNSTIQCLSATVMLSKFFIDNRFRYYVQKNWKGSQGVMPGLFANLIRSLWKNDVEVIMPTSFRNFCGRLNQEWAIDRQQDAKEFFDFVVDCLHEDLNINWQRNPLRPLTFEEEMQREKMPVAKVSRIEWDRYCHREESFISSLFAGQHASRLRCTTCKRTSTTYEAFYSISVEIPPSGTGDIYQCLRSYCQEEMLSGDEVWKCPYCKCERVATKQIIITRAPQILVVHFKRFSASKTQSARKIHTPIDFPLHGLRMDDFVFASAPPVSNDANAAVRQDMSPTAPPFTYDAYGVLRHIGSSMGSGHYISLVRDAQRQCWRKFDDDRSSDFNPRDLRYKDRLQNEQAYIVFYERVPAK